MAIDDEIKKPRLSKLNAINSIVSHNTGNSNQATSSTVIAEESSSSSNEQIKSNKNQIKTPSNNDISKSSSSISEAVSIDKKSILGKTNKSMQEFFCSLIAFFFLLVFSTFV